MKFTEFKHLPVVALVAVGLALAACGGGGSSTTPDVSNGDVTPDPAIAQRSAISTAIATATNLVNAVDNDSTDADVTEAENAITNARTAISNAGDVPATETAANTQTVNNLQTQLNGAKMARQSAMTKAKEDDAKVKKAMAAKLYAGLGETSTALDAATISISGMNVSADADGTEAGEPVTIRPSGTALPSVRGWAGTDYVRTVASPSLTDHVVLYNNREAPKTVLFATKYATQLAEDSDAGRLNNTYLTTATNQRHIASDTFASGSGFVEHTDENGDVVKIRGSFDGGMGYYHCAQAGGTSCRSTVDGAGGITLAGGWSFEPDEQAMASTPDANYLIFGWWSREVSTGVDVATFAQPAGAAVPGAANTALTGTAKYTGAAAGKYSINEPVEGDPNSGAFTAQAELTAKFGNVTDLGTISGMLFGFKAGGEDKDWTVSLRGFGTEAEAPIAPGGFGTVDSPNADGSDTARTVWSINETPASAAGSWTGDFYYETTAQQTAANTPPVAAGTFSANYGNVGRMVGAFGAGLDKQ